MQLDKLFDMQRKLDERIIKEKGLEGQDLLPQKILALQVELGELANEWRGFKYWSEDQEPRTWRPNEKDVCESCGGQPIFIENGKIIGQCADCDGCGVNFHSPLLEEYVDCLHFFLSIGLELGFKDVKILEVPRESSITDGFLEVFNLTNQLDLTGDFDIAISKFFELGEMLGFTTKQIEQAYMDKNKVNHERQNNGY